MSFRRRIGALGVSWRSLPDWHCPRRLFLDWCLWHDLTCFLLPCPLIRVLAPHLCQLRFLPLLCSPPWQQSKPLLSVHIFFAIAMLQLLYSQLFMHATFRTVHHISSSVPLHSPSLAPVFSPWWLSSSLCRLCGFRSPPDPVLCVVRSRPCRSLSPLCPLCCLRSPPRRPASPSPTLLPRNKRANNVRFGFEKHESSKKACNSPCTIPCWWMAWHLSG